MGPPISIFPRERNIPEIPPFLEGRSGKLFPLQNCAYFSDDLTTLKFLIDGTSSLRFTTCRNLDRIRRAKIQKLKTHLEKRYGVRIEIINKNTTISDRTSSREIEVPSLALQLRQLQKLKYQLSKVPPNFVKSSGLKSIVLCGKINKYNRNYKHIYKVAAFYYHATGKLYINAVWPFHHEFFHCLDYKHNGVPTYHNLGSKRSMRSEDQNFEWNKLEMSSQTDEQQAEYARILFNIDDPGIWKTQYKPLLGKAPKQAKVALMKKWLYKWSGGKLNAQYWRDLKAGKVDEAYWQ